MIESIEVRQLSLPLIKPYRLSFGPVTAFDTILVVLREIEGTGFGEATLLPGYTDETVDESWRTANMLAPIVAGFGLDEARRTLRAAAEKTAFTATAFLTAIDYLEQHPALTTPARAKLLAILSSDGSDQGAARDEVDKHIAAGYDTLKFKVGFNVESDIQAVKTIQEVVDGRAAIRIDANQGFSVEEAILFLDTLDPSNIELLEQPCDKADWNAAKAIKPRARVPIMLDESIYGPAEVDRAASEKLAEFIKFKLMKIGDMSALAGVLNQIRDHGMTPVLGNGVATDIGCWMEAAAMRGYIDNAGEMNGFLKTEISLLDPPLQMSGAEVVLDEALPALNWDAVERHTVRREVHHAKWATWSGLA